MTCSNLVTIEEKDDGNKDEFNTRGAREGLGNLIELHNSFAK